MTEKKEEIKDERSKCFFRLFISIYISTLMIVSFIISLTFQIISCILFFPLFLYSKRIRLIILGFCFRFCCHLACSPLNPFWKIKIIRKCKQNYKPTKSLLIVNHLSSLDPWIVNACTMSWNIKFVFKSSLFKIPIIGISVFLSGDIPVYFSKGKGGWEVEPWSKEFVMQTCKEYHSMNINTVVFPEGTRSLSGQLHLFKSGFFRYAIENNCEILPCALHGTNKAWPIKSKIFDKSNIYFSFGDPIQPTPGMTYQELTEKTRNTIFELIKEFPDYDPEKDKLSNERPSVRGHGI